LTEPALPRSREFLAISTLALGAFAMAMNANVLAPLMPFLAEDPIYRGMAAEELAAAFGLLGVSAGVAGAIAAFALGPVIDRIGRRVPMIAGIVIFFFASLGHLIVDSHGGLLTARALAGFGSGLAFTSCSAAVADLVPYARRGAAMGVFSAGLFLAIPVGLPLSTLLARNGQWRMVFVIQAGVGLLALLGFATLIPASLGRSDRRDSWWRVMVDVLRRPMVLPALLSVMLHTGAFAVTVQFSGKWLDDDGILPKSDHISLWVILGLTSALGSLILPRLSDRLGKRNFVLATGAGAAILLLLLGRVNDVRGLLLVGIPLTIVAAARSGPFQALMSEFVDERMRGTLMGIRAAFINLGIGGFFGIGGLVYGANGFQSLLYVAAISMVVSYFLVRLFVREPR